MKVLILNCGSSSVKYQLYDMPREICLAKGIVEKIGKINSSLKHYSKDKRPVKIKVKVSHHSAALKLVIQSLLEPGWGIISSRDEISAVGHRVVHGGERFKESTRINKKVIKAIKQYSKLAPLHNLPNLAGIYACNRLLPHLRQVAVFDTAFHQSIPAHAYLL